jgi:uncharacterized integral membrane protein
MRLRSRGNRPERTAPDQSVPTTTQPPGPVADPPPQPAADMPPRSAADASPQPGAGMVPPPDADMAPVPAQETERSPEPAAQAEPGAGAQPASGTPPQAPAAPHLPPQHKIRRTRLSGVWVGLVMAAIVLLLLLVFILENGQKADISYFGAHGHLPLGIALLLAALAGALLVLIPGSARIIQLRKTARRHRKLDATRANPHTE